MKKSRLKDYMLRDNALFFINNLNCTATLKMLNRKPIYVKAINAKSAAYKCEEILEKSLGFKQNSIPLFSGDVELL